MGIKTHKKVLEYMTSLGINFSMEQVVKVIDIIENEKKFDSSDIMFLDQKTQIEAIKDDPSRIKFIRKPNETLCLAAVTENGNAIGYIRNPSKAVKEAARASGSSIAY